LKEVFEMLTWKDTVATATTAAVVGVYAATHEAWAVPVIGSSHRWAAVLVFLLGTATCAEASGDRPQPASGKDNLFALLGILAFVLTAFAVATGSLVPLSLLVADIVVLWAMSTLRHAWRAPQAPADPAAT
jgi:hypothetical protein